MSWEIILKVDIQGLKRSFPALKNLPDDAIREFASKINDPMSVSINVKRLVSELQQKYKTGMGQKPVPKTSHFGQTSRLMKEDWFQQLKATGTVTSSSAAGGGPSDSATTEGISFFDSQGNPSLRFRKRRKKHGKKDDKKRGC
tara:strand:+ start:693 stop:1121 length:429 start_codon:yes stop_codon:yes gene_type:complete